MASTIDTWLTGLLVNSRMARSAVLRPRNSHTSPVAVTVAASASVIDSAIVSYTYHRWFMRTWKLIGLAGLAGVATTAAVVGAMRRRRSWTDYNPVELRSRLHDRLADAEARASGH